MNCRKNSEIKNARAEKTSNGKTILLLKKNVLSVIVQNQNLSKQEASGILSKLGIESSLSKVPT